MKKPRLTKRISKKARESRAPRVLFPATLAFCLAVDAAIAAKNKQDRPASSRE